MDGDAVGGAVNVAARILSKTPIGSTQFDLGTRVCMNDAEIPWEPVGRYRLKGIAGDTEVFRAIPEGHCELPQALMDAARSGQLVRVARGKSLPNLPPDPVVLLEGFTPGSSELRAVIETLPVIEPANIWLATYLVGPAERYDWVSSGRGLVIGRPEAVDAAIMAALKPTLSSLGSDTLLFEFAGDSDLDLSIAGLALPAVPLSNVVASYVYDLLPDGRWVNTSDAPVLRIEVTPGGVRLHVKRGPVSVDGRQRRAEESLTLADGASIEAAGRTLRFQALDRGYVGILWGESPYAMGVGEAQAIEIGREPLPPGLPMPDRRGHDNLRWCTGTRAARARSGGFTLDRALVGRRQASFLLSGETVEVTSLHERCATWVLREGTDRLERVYSTTRLQSDDAVVVGTTVVTARASAL